MTVHIEELQREIVNLKERLRIAEEQNAVVQRGASRAVEIERDRCAAIVMAARMGEIDTDFRSILYRIKSGDPFPKPETPN